MSNPPNEVPNPYVGPRSFQVGERIYGRKRETNQLLNLIIAERIVLLHSPSGAGKTSLIQAALLPRLVKMKFQVLPVVRVNLDVSDSLAKGFECNRYIFSALLSLEEDVPEEKKISPEWLAKLSLMDYLDQRYRPEGSMDVEVLIFDQFEEILTLDPTDQEDKKEFFRQVGEALEAPNRWALFSMRDDYVASLEPYLEWIPNRLSINFRLDLLGIEAARRAIQQPAREAGVEFEEAAAEKLVDDLRRVRVQQPDGSLERQLGPYVEPVQMQVVCFRVWENPRPDQQRITAGDLAELGQVDQSLVDSSLAEYYALRVLAAAAETGTSERAIREWFDRRLITEQGVRGTVVMGSETSGGLDNKAIKLLVDAHLVRAERRGGATWYELSHDRLLEPVRESNIAWYSENLSLLQRQADLWQEEGREEGLLLVGETLDEAQEWAQEYEGQLTQVEQDFLKASLEMRRREERERALEQEKLEAAEKLAEEQTRSARRARRWTIAIGIVGLLTVAIAVVAIWQFIESSATSNFIEAIVDCEGEKHDSCIKAAKAAAAEEEDRYFLLVVQTCEDGMQAVVKVDGKVEDKEDYDKLSDAVDGACEQAVKLSNNIKGQDPFPLLYDLCNNLWGMNAPAAADITKKICNPTAKRAAELEDLLRVKSTCTISSQVGVGKDVIVQVCSKAVDLAVETDRADNQGESSEVRDMCLLFGRDMQMPEEVVQEACGRAIDQANEKGGSTEVGDLCLFIGRDEKMRDEVVQEACGRAVNLAVETGDSFLAGDLCLLFGRDEKMRDEIVQQSCDQAIELAVEKGESLVLKDLCFSGFEAGQKACEGAIDQAVEEGAIFVLNDMCLSGPEAGLAAEDIQAACEGAIDQAVEKGESLVLKDLCFSGIEAGLADGVLQTACGRAIDQAIKTGDSFVLGELCLFGPEAGVSEEVLQTACGRAIDQAVETGDFFVVKDLCIVGRDSRETGGTVQKACGGYRTLSAKLAETSRDPNVLSDICISGPEAGLAEEVVQKACGGYRDLSATLAETSRDPDVLRDMCFSGLEAGLSQEVVQMACESAVDLAVDLDDPYIPKDLCLYAQDSGLPAENIQQSCDLAIDLAFGTGDPYVLSDMCFSGPEAGLAEEVLQVACEGAIEQAVETGDSYILSDMCFYGPEAGLSEEVVQQSCDQAIDLAVETDDSYVLSDMCFYGPEVSLSEEVVQRACGGYRDLSATLAETSDDPYVLSEMCLSGLDAGLEEEDIQTACDRAVELAVEFDAPYVLSEMCISGLDAGLEEEDIQTACDRAVELAVEFDDLYIHKDLCLFGQDSGLSAEDVQQSCDLAIELAIEFDDTYVLSELCLFDRFRRLSEADLRRACDQASNQILPGEQRSAILDPETFDLLSFQGLEGQTVTIAMIGVSENLNLNLILLDPRGDRLFDDSTRGEDQIALIDQLQLAESGTYIIGIYNPDPISDEYDLEFMLE